MVSNQLITVRDYNWIIIISNNLKGVVSSNYSAYLNRMLNSWWYEQTKLLIASWNEDLDSSSSILGSYLWFSSHPKHGDDHDNRGSRAIRRHFVSH